MIPNLFRSISYRFSDKHFLHKNGKISNPILSPNYEKAAPLSIDNIAAKFEDVTPCSYRDILQTKLEIARYISHLSTCFCAQAQKQHIPIVI